MIGLPTWISLRRTRPLSDAWGFDRGTPVDRFYLEEFLERQRGDVRGDVLEVKSQAYTRRFGGDAVTEAHVLDIDPDNSEATIVADLNEPQSLPADAFDCCLLMQTLQLVRKPDVALANAWSALRIGGTLLLTVPSASPVERFLPDLWRWTPAGVKELLAQACPDGLAEVRAYGNVLACCAFFQGMAAEELRPDRLRDHDPALPLVVCARVVRPAQSHRAASPPRAAS